MTACSDDQKVSAVNDTAVDNTVVNDSVVVSPSTTRPSPSTTAPGPATPTTLPEPPPSVRTAVGTWTRDASTALVSSSVPAAAAPVGPGDDRHGHWPVYRVDGRWISVTPDDPEAGTYDNVQLTGWRLTDAGTWERAATDPSMPAYRMRYTALMSIEPVVREHDIVLLDADGNMLSVTSTGTISAAEPPSLGAHRTTTPTDGLVSLAATDDAYLAVTGRDEVGMWRVGWTAWRYFWLPSSAPMDQRSQVGQVRQVNGEFYVDMVGSRDLVPWRLVEPA